MNRTFTNNPIKNRLHLSILSALAIAAVGIGCARETTVYSDPVSPSAVSPVSTNDPTALPTPFANQSVNRAAVEKQPDGVSATSKAIRFQTSSGANSIGGFNGSGLGNRAILGVGGWQSRPVGQAEPLTFDAKYISGSEGIGANLQIDLKCDGTMIRVVNASAANIDAQTHSAVSDGYIRFTASTLAPIWISPTAAITDPGTSAVLVPASGPGVSLSNLLSKFPAACLKNAVTNAIDLPDRVSTNAVLLSLGSDSTTSENTVFVRRISIGSEIHETFE